MYELDIPNNRDLQPNFAEFIHKARYTDADLSVNRGTLN